MLRFLSWLVQDVAKPQFPPYMAGAGSAQLGRCLRAPQEAPVARESRSEGPQPCTSPSPGRLLGYLSVLFGLTANLWSLTVLARLPVGPA